MSVFHYVDEDVIVSRDKGIGIK